MSTMELQRKYSANWRCSPRNWFYEQGMNASFEDVVELDKIMDEFGFNWELILKSLMKQKKTDGDFRQFLK